MNQLNLALLSTLAASSLAVLFITAAAGPVGTAPPHLQAIALPPTMGAVLPLTGPLSVLGLGMADAARLARGHINEGGGVLRTNLSLLVEDSQTSPVAAQDAATRLVASGASAIVGGAATGESFAIFQATGPVGVLEMTPSASNPLFTNLDANDLFWRATASDALQGRVGAVEAKAYRGWNTVGVMAENTPYGTGVAMAFRENYTRMGGTAARSVLFTPGQFSYTAELQALFATNLDAVFLVAIPPDGLAILRDWWANRAAWPTEWLFADTLFDQVFTDQLAGLGVDVTGLTGVVKKGLVTAENQTAHDLYRTAYVNVYGREPTLFSANTYDAVFVISLAMEAAANATSPGAFKDWMRVVANPPGLRIFPTQWGAAIAAIEAGQDIDYVGASGSLNFDVMGDVGSSYCVWQVNASGQIGVIRPIAESDVYNTSEFGNLRPAVALLLPEAGSVLSGDVIVAGRSRDPEGANPRVEIRVDNGTWEAANGTTSWSHALGTSGLSEGPHVISTRSYDGVDYSQEDRVEVLVENTVPGAPIDLFVIATVAAIAVLATGAAVFAIVMRNRRKPPRSESPGQL